VDADLVDEGSTTSPYRSATIKRSVPRRIKIKTTTTDPVVKKMKRLMRPTTESESPNTASGDIPKSVGTGPADPVDPVVPVVPVDPVDPVDEEPVAPVDILSLTP